MEGALARRYDESTVPVYDITRNAKECIERVAGFTNLNIADLCKNMVVLSIVFTDLEKIRKEFAKTIKILTDGFDSMGEMIQEMEAQIGRDEELEREYNNLASEAAKNRNQANEEFDNLKKELGEKEEELHNEEAKIETAVNNTNIVGAIGIGAQIGVGVVGLVSLFVAPPVGLALCGASLGVGAGNIAVVVKSENEIKIMRDHIDDLKRKVQNKQEAMNESAREYHKYNAEALEKSEQSKKKREKIRDFRKYQSQLDKCKRYLLALQLFIDFIHSSVSVFNGHLEDHQKVGVSAIMKKKTEAAYKIFKESWEKISEDRVYCFLKNKIGNYMDKDKVMLAIGEAYY